ncbi:hypothetical protein ACWIG5_41695, partial [Streptomyces lydicus]
GTLLYKAWTRRHMVALGPDGMAVREALTTARSLFGEIIDERGCDASWFLAEERRDTGQRLKDLSQRRDDPELRQAMVRVAQAWGDASGSAQSLYLSWLADSYLTAGEVEQAADVAGRALDLASGVASVRPRQRLAPILRRLGEHRTVPAVVEVLDRARG